MSTRSLPRPSAVAIVAAGLLAHGAVHAAASSLASLTNLTFTLVDLNRDDGITPSITFADVSYTWAYAYNSNPYEVDSLGSVGSGAFDASSVAASTSRSAAIGTSTGSTPATINGAGTTVVGSLHASGSAGGTGGTLGSDYSNYSAGAQWSGYYSSSFSLSANTALVISANATTSAAVTHGYIGSPYDHEQASGYVSLYLSGLGASGNGSQSSNDGFQSFVWNLGGADVDSKSGMLAASFVNVSSGSLTGYFHAQAIVDGTSYAAAVPEPETYAMLLAGLGIVGLQARRKKR